MSVVDAADRFRDRKERLKSISSDESLVDLSEQVDPMLVEEFRSAQSSSGASRIAMDNFYRAYELDTEISVTDEEVAEYLRLIETGVDEAKFNNLITACRNDVISAVVTPFGLGGIVATFDKDGGNVDTIRNVRDGVYATEKERTRWEAFKEADGKRQSEVRTLRQQGKNAAKYPEYYGHGKYVKKGKEYKDAIDGGHLKDAYTGETFSKDKKVSKVERDHVIPVNEIQNDAGRVLTGMDGPDLANTESNLRPTEKSINISKKHNNASKWAADLESKKGDYKKRLEQLNNLEMLNDEQRKEKRKLEKLSSVDSERVKEHDEAARKDYERSINQYYMSGKFAKNVAVTSSVEGVKMGLQQALGLLLTELFQGLFDEIVDIYKNGFYGSKSNQKMLGVLQERLQRIAKRVLEKRKDICVAFGQGAISGFLSNIVTVLINVFRRTSRRVVRMIREGFFSLLRAIKLLCFPPPGMTGVQAAHEASKLIATGIVVVGGVALEQYIDTLIKTVPLLEPVAGLLTAVLVGVVTGLTVTFVVYTIDKLDLFKANEAARREQITEAIASNRDALLEEAQELADSLEALLL